MVDEENETLGAVDSSGNSTGEPCIPQHLNNAGSSSSPGAICNLCDMAVTDINIHWRLNHRRVRIQPGTPKSVLGFCISGASSSPSGDTLLRSKWARKKKLASLLTRHKPERKTGFSRIVVCEEPDPLEMYADEALIPDPAREPKRRRKTTVMFDQDRRHEFSLENLSSSAQKSAVQSAVFLQRLADSNFMMNKEASDVTCPTCGELLLKKITGPKERGSAKESLAKIREECQEAVEHVRQCRTDIQEIPVEEKVIVKLEIPDEDEEKKPLVVAPSATTPSHPTIRATSSRKSTRRRTTVTATSRATTSSPPEAVPIPPTALSPPEAGPIPPATPKPTEAVPIAPMTVVYVKEEFLNADVKMEPESCPTPTDEHRTDNRISCGDEEEKSLATRLKRKKRGHPRINNHSRGSRTNNKKTRLSVTNPPLSAVGFVPAESRRLLDGSRLSLLAKNPGSTLVLNRIFLRRSASDATQSGVALEDSRQPVVVEQDLHVSLQELPRQRSLVPPAPAAMEEEEEESRRQSDRRRRQEREGNSIWGRLGNPEALLCQAASLLS